MATHPDIEAISEPGKDHQGLELVYRGDGADSSSNSSEGRLGHELNEELKERHISMIALSANIGFGLTINSGIILRLLGPVFTIFTYILSAIVCWFVIPPFSEMTASMNISGPLWGIPKTFFSTSLGLASSWMYLFTWATIYPNECGVLSHIISWNYTKTWDDVDAIAATPAPWTAAQLSDKQSSEPSVASLAVNWNATHPDRAMYDWATWGPLGTTDTTAESWQKVGFIALALLSTWAINSFRVRIYGELEYYFGWIKIVGLSILVIAMAGIWSDPIRDKDKGLSVLGSPANPTGPFGFYMGADKGVVTRESSSTSDLIAMWTAIRWAFFGFLGPEAISIAAGEAKYSTVDIKPATRKTLVRIFSLYIIMIISVVVNVNRAHPNLLALYSNPPPSSSNSPIMIALVEAAVRGKPGYRGLAHFANILFAFSVWSCACTALYIASRTLHSLAVQGKIPTRYLQDSLKRTNGRGVPQNAVNACVAFGLIAFLSSTNKARAVLDALCAIGTICWLTVMAVLALCFLRFLEVIQYYHKHQPEPRVNRSHTNKLYPYRTMGQPIRSYIGFAACALHIFFGGFYAFLWVGKDGSRVGKHLAQNYITMVLFLALYIGHKAANGTLRDWKAPEPERVDIQGWVALTSTEAKRKQSLRERILYWLK